ncbi:hypothetical protein MXB_1536 [Myxobolus squamalis]|nr:hypothetical protein MXB_1536 [Myxobolus squamalis]
MPDFKEMLETKRRALSEAEDQQSQLVIQINERKEENESVLTEIENIMRRIEMKKSEIARRENQMRDLCARLSKAESEKETYVENSSKDQSTEIELDSLESEYREILEQIQCKETKLNGSEMKISKLKNDIEQATKRLMISKERAGALTKEVDSLREQTSDEHHDESFNEDDAHSRRKELDETIRLLDVANDDLSRKISIKTGLRNNLQRTLNSHLSKIEKLQQEKCALEEELLG